MASPGIGLVNPELAERVSGMTAERRRAAVQVVCLLVKEEAQLNDIRVEEAHAALLAGRYGDSVIRQSVMALVGELDESAWDVQDRVDAGHSSRDDYLRAFRKARSAAALAMALEDDSLAAALDSLYEAHFALENPSELGRALE